MRLSVRKYAVASACLVFTLGASAYETPTNVPLKQVFIMESEARDAGPFNSVRAALLLALRNRMIDELPGECTLMNLNDARYANVKDDTALAIALKRQLAGRGCDLAIAVGDSSARMMAKIRDEVFPGAPALMVACDAPGAGTEFPPSNTVVLARRVNPAAAIDNILRVRPDTTNIVVVLGDSALERRMFADYRAAFAVFTNRVGIQWLNKLRFERVQGICSNLPPQSAIFFGSLISDHSNVDYDYNFALHQLSAVANAPVFALYESQFGDGVVGGPLMPDRTIGEKAAEVAFRLLGGEKPERIVVPEFGLSSPVYDGRELARWHIDEGNFPPGSHVVFRPPTLWDQYRLQIVVLATCIVAMAACIAALLGRGRRLRRAYEENAQRRNEVAHLSRVTMLGELSGSLAHEMNQPLGAMIANADAAEIHLRHASPDLQEVRSILNDIRKDGLRAGEIIHRMRSFLRRHEVEREPLDAEQLVREVIKIGGADAAVRRMDVQLEVEPGLPRIFGDRVQLQQVLLNLMVNGMDAMADSPADRRRLAIKARRLDAHAVEVLVSDGGHGVAPEKLAGVFEPFFTTKRDGLGLGLPICRSIVEAHGGRIVLENAPSGGVTARFTLPIHGKEHR